MFATLKDMTRAQRNANIAGVFVPFAGFLAAIVVFWDNGIDGADLAMMATLHILTGLGITIGFHRLFTHRAFAAPRPVQWALAILGSMTVQGPLADWVADHRKHHAHTDAEGDPHSPHVGHGSGLSGLWHAHVGWLFETQGQADRRRYAGDIMDDPVLKWISKRFVLWVYLSLAIPFALGVLLHGGILGGLQGLLWGGLVRIFFLHHITWSINSICHFTGKRRFAVEDHSTNVAWLALPSLGEAWHHNHHAFPRSADHGLAWYEIDVSGLLIRGMEKVGLARNVVRISPERQLQKLATASPPEPEPAPEPAPERELAGVAD